MAAEVKAPMAIKTKVVVDETSGNMITEIWWIALRSLTKLTRNPTVLFFSLVMPLIWLGIFSQTFGTVFSRGASMSGALPLPYDYVAILLPGIAVMTAIQSAAQSGFSMVTDIETGFMDKFFVSPISRISVLIGKTIADGLRMAGQSAIILLIAFVLKLIAGWRIPFTTGLLGAIIVVLLAAGFGISFSGLSNTIALRTKNTEATMLVSFSLTFPLLFLSTAMLPAQLLPQWVQDFSKINPVSYVADAARSLILTGYDWTAIGKALLSLIILGTILNVLAIMAFRAQGK